MIVLELPNFVKRLASMFELCKYTFYSYFIFLLFKQLLIEENVTIHLFYLDAALHRVARY